MKPCLRAAGLSFLLFAACAPDPRTTARERQVEQTRGEMDQLSASLAELQARKQEQERLQAAASDSALAARGNDLRNLSDLLQSDRSSRGRLLESADLQRQSLMSAAAGTRAQIEAGLQALERDMERTRLQLRANAEALANTPEIRAQAVELQTILAQQGQWRDDLLSQRTALAVTVADRSRVIAGETEALSAALVDDELSVQNEIYAARDEMTQAQRLRETSRVNLMSLNRQLEQTQKDYDERSRRLRELEGEPAASE